jgi:hypothetical protein
MMNQDKKHYMEANISNAMYCLAAEDKLLRERVVDAHGYLLRTSCHDGFEAEFEVIGNHLGRAKHGDYSQITETQLVAVVDVVMSMFGRLPKV